MTLKSSSKGLVCGEEFNCRPHINVCFILASEIKKSLLDYLMIPMNTSWKLLLTSTSGQHPPLGGCRSLTTANTNTREGWEVSKSCFPSQPCSHSSTWWHYSAQQQQSESSWWSGWWKRERRKSNLPKVWQYTSLNTGRDNFPAEWVILLLKCFILIFRVVFKLFVDVEDLKTSSALGVSHLT